MGTGNSGEQLGTKIGKKYSEQTREPPPNYTAMGPKRRKKAAS